MEKEVKKVGIITLHGYNNYGNRLQNYALQKAVKSLGFNTETVVIQDMPVKDKTRDRIINVIYKLIKTDLYVLFKKAYKRVSKKINYYKNKNIIYERTKIFKSFSKKFLNERFRYNLVMN